MDGSVSDIFRHRSSIFFGGGRILSGVMYLNFTTYISPPILQPCLSLAIGLVLTSHAGREAERHTTIYSWQYI